MSAERDVATMSFEEARQALEEIVEVLESGETSLDDALRHWERGEALHRRCQEILDDAERRVADLRGNGSGPDQAS